MDTVLLTRIDPGWADYHGFESPLLQKWVEAGPLGARLLGLTLPRVALVPDPRSGALARRLEAGPYTETAASEIHSTPGPLEGRLARRAPDRLPPTRGDESRQLAGFRQILGGPEANTNGHDGTPYQDHRAA